MATMNAPTNATQMKAPAKHEQIRVTRRSPAYWRVTIDTPPINVMGPEMVRQFQDVRGVNAVRGSESGHPLERGGAVNAAVKEEVENAGIDGNAVMAGSIAEVNGDFDSLT